MTKISLEKFYEIIPDGEWIYDSETNTIIDPSGKRIVLSATPELTFLEQKLYTEFIYRLISDSKDVLAELSQRKDEISALFKEIYHHERRHHEGYIKGIEKAAYIVSNTEAVSPTSRDILNSVIDKLAEILDHERERHNNEVSSK